jgi:hypothetical protein
VPEEEKKKQWTAHKRVVWEAIEEYYLDASDAAFTQLAKAYKRAQAVFSEVFKLRANYRQWV